MKQLRGIKPETRPPARLKILLTGEAKVGKSLASLDMPVPYSIDDEQGTRHQQHARKIIAAGGRSFEPNGTDDVIEEVKTLASSEHEFKTVIIDPLTTLYEKDVEEGERKFGDAWGKHYAYANKKFKKLYHILSHIDMNVVVICHSKVLYGEDMTVIGETFDGPKKLDYLFDLWLHLKRDQNAPAGSRRIATVRGSRLDTFKEGESFTWSYAEFEKRYGKENLEKGVTPIALASEEQVEKFTKLCSLLNEIELSKLRVNDVLEDAGGAEFLTQTRIEKGITLIEKFLEEKGNGGLMNLIANALPKPMPMKKAA
jgi:hypothetical protein